MYRFIPTFALLASIFIFSDTGFAQASATTIPVGFNTATVPAAVNASTPSSTVISAAFYAVPADFQGAVSSVDSANQLSMSSAAFGSLTTTPHLARMKTGPSVGRFFIITANTATQFTLDTATAGYTITSGAPSNTQAQVTVGDSVEVLPANTLGTLFGTATVPFQTGASAGAADNVYLFNNGGWEVYFHNGTSWRKTGSFANQNNTVVLPDRGMFILRRAVSSLPLTFLGTVPSTTERSDFVGPGSTFKTNRFPVDATLGGAATATTYPLNLQTLSGWLTGASANAADNVYLWDGTGWVVYFHNGTSWRKTGSFANQDTQVIPLGTAMFVVRRSTATGATSTLVQTLPYTL